MLQELAKPMRPAEQIRLEDETIWTREWVCIGTQGEVADTGDLLPFTVGDHAIHVERLADGGLTGRFNMAQHGGCRTVPVQCQQGAKTACSFTSCGYSRDRKVLKQDDPDRYQYLGLRPERLLQVRVVSIGPLIFVHLDPSGADAVILSRRLDPLLPKGTAGACRWLEIERPWRNFGRAPAAEAATGIRTAGFFPNLLLLARGESAASVVLQPLSPRRTLARVTTFTRRDDRGWPALIEDFLRGGDWR